MSVQFVERAQLTCKSVWRLQSKTKRFRWNMTRRKYVGCQYFVTFITCCFLFDRKFSGSSNIRCRYPRASCLSFRMYTTDFRNRLTQNQKLETDRFVFHNRISTFLKNWLANLVSRLFLIFPVKFHRRTKKVWRKKVLKRMATVLKLCKKDTNRYRSFVIELQKQHKN